MRRFFLAFAVLIHAASAAPPNRTAHAPPPQTNMFTFALTGGVSSAQNAFSGKTPQTTLGVVPLETSAYAIRVGFCNPFNYPVVITSAAAYPSTTYSLAANVDANQANVAVVPTGGGSSLESKLYFTFGGADDPRVNDGSYGTTRGITIQGANTTSPNYSCVIQWTDWAPFQSLARTDGGSQTLAFIYVTFGGTGSYTYTMPGNAAGYFNANNAQGRKVMFALDSAWGTDHTDAPASAFWQQGGAQAQNAAFYAVQYMSLNYGNQILVVGDSLSVAPTNDNMSPSLWRAAMSMSTPTSPIGFASVAWGGQAFLGYGETARLNLSSIKPTVYAAQAISRNDAFTTAGQLELLGKHANLYTLANRAWGTRLIWQQPGGEPSADGNGTQTGAFSTIYSLMKSLTNTPFVPFIDCMSVIGNPAAPWDYLTGYSDDNTHPNTAGAAACVPLATSALQGVLY